MNLALYLSTGALLLISFLKDRRKTRNALMKSWRALENILPQLLVVILLVGVMLTLMDTELIIRLIGSDSSWFGVVIAAVVGSITLIPGFVAFPLAAMLLQNGAGYMQIAAFVSTLMMVGVMTLPVEIKCFGRRLAIIRNLLAFIFSFLVAFVIGYVEVTL